MIITLLQANDDYLMIEMMVINYKLMIISLHDLSFFFPPYVELFEFTMRQMKV